MSYRAGPFSPLGLGFLCLIPVAITLILQAFQVGLNMTVGMALPVSDSNVWAGCASSIAQLSEPQNLGWCLKRPVTMFLQAPEFVLAPQSMSAAIVLQILGISALLWWFLLVLGRTQPVGRAAVVALLVIAMWPVLWYGTYLGPEGPALALAFVSATAALKFLFSLRSFWGYVSGAAALLVLQIRPGNPLLTITIMVAVVVMLWRSASTRRAAIAVALGYPLTWWLPLQVMKALGWSDAGHASNFWFTLYSAATPEQDTWMSAYERYAAQVGCPSQWSPDPCLGLDSAAFVTLVRNATEGMIQQYPLAIPRQMLTNLESVAQSGYLGNLLSWPYPPAWQGIEIPGMAAGWHLVGLAVGTLLALASLVLATLLVAALVLIRKNSTQAKARFDALPAAGRRTLRGSLWLGAITVLGAIGFYSLVGHDEQARHMVQNIPFILVSIAAVWVAIVAPGKWESDVSRPASPAKWRVFVIAVILLTVLIAAVIEGHSQGTTITLAGKCGGADRKSEEFTVVSAVSWGAATPVDSPASWRVLSSADGQMLPADYSWTGTQLALLPAGALVYLRSSVNGNLMPAFIKAGDYPSSGSATWCLRSPSNYGTMLVYDLVPTSGL